MERSFHMRNRQELYRAMPERSLFVCFAGRILPQSADAEYPFFANRNFAYLTGLDGAEVHDFIFLARKEGNRWKRPSSPCPRTPWRSAGRAAG